MTSLRRIKILAVLGTRPEIIKLAPVLRKLRADRAFALRLILTGQHREMAGPFLLTFGLRPDGDLRVMRRGQSPARLAALVRARLGPVLARERPDLVLVQGDTTSAAAAAEAAFRRKIPVAHVEAGLRSHDLRNPWPEEGNRRRISAVASLHLAPTPQARRNLLREGTDPRTVFVTGNTVVDALRFIARRGRRKPASLAAVDFSKRVLLVTLHRRETQGKAMAAMARAVRGIVEKDAGVEAVWPVHPSPDVRASIVPVLRGAERIHLLPPLPYEDFVYALRRCRLVLTDSGGIQEEAPTFGKKVLVLRRVTERVEGLRSGAAVLVGTDPRRIETAARRFLRAPRASPVGARGKNPYGDGRAAARIVAILKRRARGAP